MTFKKTANSELGRPDTETFKKQGKFPVIVILENIRSLLNVGSVFRTADAFNIEAVYLCGITGTPPNKEINKSALGSTESVDWSYFKTCTEALEAAKEKGFTRIAVEQTKDSTFLSEFKYDKGQKIALVFGNEVEGVEQDTIDQCQHVIEIPQMGTKHSLNVSVSAGVVLWELVRNELNY